MGNPVFGNELRKSVFRRKPLLCFAGWAAGIAVLILLVSNTPSLTAGVFLWFPHIFLPVVAPPFAAGAFAKEKEQRTWQDLYLTTLTTQQILVGKFLGSYLPVIVALGTLLPPVIIGYWLNVEGTPVYAYAYSSFGFERRPDVAAESLILILKCVLQTIFYVLLAFVCSHYAKTQRVALGACYVSLAVYAILSGMLISTIDSPGMLNASKEMVGLGETMHLITCSVVSVGFWLLLSVGLRFEAQ